MLASGFKYPRQTRRLGYLATDIASCLSLHPQKPSTDDGVDTKHLLLHNVNNRLHNNVCVLKWGRAIERSDIGLQARGVSA